MQQITEEMKVHEKWYERARNQTLESLPEFHRHLMEDYRHDYGTICHALSAGSVASAWALNNAPQGNITGFQAGFVMWGFIQNWNTRYKDKPIRLIDYGDLLYPQNDDKFARSIKKSTWEWLMGEAKKQLLFSKREDVHPAVYRHWIDIFCFEKVPFGMQVVAD